jgi:hypothetical protein
MLDEPANALPITRRKRRKFHESLNDLGREAVGCMGLLGSRIILGS